MRMRLLQVIGVAAAMVIVLVLLKLAAVPAASQDQAPAGAAARTATGGLAPRTTWGEPDLQGLWTAEVSTLQRPTRYGNREFFTDDERAELDRRQAELLGADRRSARSGHRGPDPATICNGGGCGGFFADEVDPSSR